MAEIHPSEKTKLVSYAIRDIVIEAKKEERQGTKMIYLNIGDPAKFGFAPPENIISAVKSALDKNFKGYAPSEGDPELREKIAKLENCNVEDVFITAGLSEAIDFFFYSCLNPGDKVLLPNPCYPLYITKGKVNNADMQFYSHDANGEVDITDLKKKIKNAKFLVLINPNNPTSAVYSEKNLADVVKICAENSVPIFYDAAYDKLCFESEPDFRKLAMGKVPFAYGSSISKNFLYPGARVGWISFYGEEWKSVKEAFLKMCNQRLSVNWEMQKGAVAALDDYSHLKNAKKQLIERRDAMMKIAKSLPLEFPKPMGAFYSFMKITSNKWNSDWDFVRAGIKQGVVLVPGSAFGKQETTSFRCTFLPGPELMETAFEKIGKLL